MDQELGAWDRDFPATSVETWRTVVAKALGGAAPETALATRAADGLAFKPLYSRADQPVAPAPLGAAGRSGPRWDVRTVLDDPRLEQAAGAAAEDVAGGATSLTLRIAGDRGLRLASVDDLEAILAGLPLSRTPLVLDMGGQAFAGAAALMALWQRRGLAPDEAQGALNLDPLGALAAEGRLAGGLTFALDLLAGFTRKVVAHYPGVSALGVDTRPYHAAGASEAQEIAIALATGLAYLRAHDAAGFSLEEVVPQLRFVFAVDSHFFRSLAKLRAARLAWARLCEGAGLSGEEASMPIWAESAWRELAARDPYVNMLRGTAACFAAAVGGAQAISIRPFDEALTVPGSFGRRMARNVQHVLAEEAGLGRVADPAAGSFALEAMSEALAAQAWGLFQAIEAEGGMAGALQSGFIARAIGAVAETRARALATRAEPITGVSLYPDLSEPMVSRAAIDEAALARSVEARAASARRSDATKRLLAVRGGQAVTLIEAAFETLDGGAAFPDAVETLAGRGSETAVARLVALRLAAPFEALRDRADSLARRPQVFLAPWGKARDTGEPAQLARQCFAVAGFEAISGVDEEDGARLAAQAKASGARIVVLCASAKALQTGGPAVLAALKAAGAAHLCVTAPPDQALAAAGAEGFIHEATDILALLTTSLDRLGALS